MRETILIVDDESELRKRLVKLFRLEGFITLEAATCTEAVELMKKEDIAAAVLDVKLPDGNGIDLAATLRSLNPSCEMILLTAHGTIEDGVRAIKEGAFDYITKGDEDNKILPVVLRAVEKVQMKKRLLNLKRALMQNIILISSWGNPNQYKTPKP